MIPGRPVYFELAGAWFCFQRSVQQQQYVVTHMKTQMASTKHQIHTKLVMKNGQTTSHTSLAQAQQADAEQVKRQTPQEAQAQAPGARATLSRVETRKTNEGGHAISHFTQIDSKQNSSTDQINTKQKMRQTHTEHAKQCKKHNESPRRDTEHRLLS